MLTARGLTCGETVAAGVALQLLLAVLAVKVILAGRAQVHWKTGRKPLDTHTHKHTLEARARPHIQNSLEGGREGVLTGVDAVRVLMRRKTGWRRCLRWARQLAASGVFFQ